MHGFVFEFSKQLPCECSVAASRGVTRLDGARVKKQFWHPPMFEAEVFWKQMYCIEESTCDIVGTFRPRDSSPRVLCPPAPPCYAPGCNTPPPAMLFFSTGFCCSFADCAAEQVTTTALSLFFPRFRVIANKRNPLSVCCSAVWMIRAWASRVCLCWTSLLLGFQGIVQREWLNRGILILFQPSEVKRTRECKGGGD